MNSSSKILELKRQIDLEERNIKNCSHDFKEAIYEPETVRVQDDRGGYEGHGADRWPVPSYHNETKDRWSRECSKCGFKQYTYKQEPVVTAYKPKF